MSTQIGRYVAHNLTNSSLLMFATFNGSISGHNFLYRHAEWVKTEFIFLFLIHTFKSKICPVECLHTFVQGSHTCIFAMNYTSIEIFPNVGKLCICGEPACTAGCSWLCYNFLYSNVLISGQFFLVSLVYTNLVNRFHIQN